MTSTPWRHSASLAIPATQNTAPILDFRCLYTHDLRQKKKRWQDGILRFHTFNKRVMVYDTERNFIGDTHWREDQAVQDGDELKLEKGVLIQIGEETGRSEQDLTELLEKRRPIQQTSPRSAADALSNHAVTTRSSVAPVTQLRPKTLNALLGTPRGAYGRATLPATSPYEARKQNSNHCAGAEPPPKRQRIDTEGASRSALAPTTPRPIHLKSPPINASEKVASAVSSLKRVPIPREVITVESDDESQISSSPVRNMNKSVQHAPKRPDKPVKAVPKSQKSPRQSHQSLEKSVATAPKVIRASTSASRRSIRNEDDKPINPLRIASGKARKKLMYRELLQRVHVPPTTGPNADAGTRSPGLIKGSSTSKRALTPPGELEIFRQAQQKLLDSRLEKCRDHNVLVEQDSLLDIVADVEDHQMFDLAGDATSNTSPIHTDNEENQIDGEEWPEQEESLFVSQDARPEKNWLSKMDQILIVVPDPLTRAAVMAEPSKPLPSKQIPILPSEESTALDMNSEKPQLLHKLPTKATGPQKLKAAPLPPPYPNPAPTSRRSPLRKALTDSDKYRPLTKAPLTRATSDVTNLCSASRTTSAQKGKPQLEDNDIGPWSREAFDLFGWRPGDEKRIGQKVS